MIEVKGKYNTAKVYIDHVEEQTVSQIIELCNQEFVKDSTIRIMPDTHAGAGCTIGTTMTISDKIVPNLVGVDIGCGMEAVRLKVRKLDLGALDSVIRKNVPSGFDIRSKIHKYEKKAGLEDLRCLKHVNFRRAQLSVGTLGGGNHFIEVDVDQEGKYWLVVHSGSRNLGKQVAEYYQKTAFNSLNKKSKEKQKLIEDLKEQGRKNEIQDELKKLNYMKVPKQLAYVEGDLFDDYLHDMEIVQQYAVLNRLAIVDEILGHMKVDETERFTTIHNYIEVQAKILRKGAIAVYEGQKVLIPMNMRDGALICIGKGNADWNYSAPHGAGRLMSRGAAKERISMEEYKKSMEGIYTTCVDRSTVDEAPMAYKPMEEIINNINDTVEILDIIKPVYNFKASE
ncbi:RtcB family protein [Petroclostridium sp. X23]|uniref:RtcB family protein n=1 Tax=Petroclostridium sp. X23 TaxID=3045146 RepID=UPI0024AD1D35|nr:RtcB family protein [Petroclostridium sp. X23]WHH60334.1 RtcB family protein [Petroclostridium sp. X23]